MFLKLMRGGSKKEGYKSAIKNKEYTHRRIKYIIIEKHINTKNNEKNTENTRLQKECTSPGQRLNVARGE